MPGGQMTLLPTGARDRPKHARDYFNWFRTDVGSIVDGFWNGVLAIISWSPEPPITNRNADNRQRTAKIMQFAAINLQMILHACIGFGKIVISLDAFLIDFEKPTKELKNYNFGH